MPSSLLKKAKLPAAFNCLQCCSCSQPSSPRKRLKPSPPALRFPQARAYADVKPETLDFRDNWNWPCRRTPAFTPTPYDIFDLEKRAVYSKHKYLELVKLYHPDRHSACEGLPHLERLERYRLVVQAHEILSDPAKRKAYDTTGAGWGQRNTPTRHSRGYSSGPDGRTYGFGPEHDSSIFQNATWEDWERWYRRHEDPSAEKQAYGGTYVHPNAFASFVILMAVLSGVYQATRAGQYSGKLEERAKAFTEETSRFLSERADHYERHKLDADGRIKHFLEKRDPMRYGLKDKEEETYKRHFRNGDLPLSKPRAKEGGVG